ncbi:MAG: hypothetical protein AABX51_01430 [Nanoarchaeota archaeon]
MRIVFIGLTIILFVLGFLWIQAEKTIYFDHQINTKIPSDVLWNELKQGILDSGNSRIWPEVNYVETPEFKSGAKMVVTYTTPFGIKKYPYTLENIRDGRFFAYSPARGHPFTGSVTVEIFPTTAGNYLQWKGVYKYRGFSMFSLYYSMFFQKQFFTSLDENIKKMESQV